MSARTSLAAKIALIAVICSVDVKPAMLLASPPMRSMLWVARQAIRSAVGLSFEIVKVLQRHHRCPRSSLCPTTGLHVQRWFADEVSEASKGDQYETVACPACALVHL